MRKQYKLLIILIVVLIIICLVGRIFIMENNKVKKTEKELKQYEATLEVVKDINQNSDFCGLELLKFSDKSSKNQQSNGAYDIAPSEGVIVAESGIEGYYFNYPIDSNDDRLTQISITVAPYHVYGITVGQSISDVTHVLDEKGFTEFDKKVLYDGTDMINYRQHNVSIFIDVYKDTGIIGTITVSVYDKEDTVVY